jgi:hypothetical protein
MKKTTARSQSRSTSYAALLPMPRFRPIQKPLFPTRLRVRPAGRGGELLNAGPVELGEDHGGRKKGTENRDKPFKDALRKALARNNRRDLDQIAEGLIQDATKGDSFDQKWKMAGGSLPFPQTASTTARLNFSSQLGGPFGGRPFWQPSSNVDSEPLSKSRSRPGTRACGLPTESRSPPPSPSARRDLNFLRPFYRHKNKPRPVQAAGASQVLPQLWALVIRAVSGDGGCRPDWAVVFIPTLRPSEHHVIAITHCRVCGLDGRHRSGVGWPRAGSR